MCGITGFIRKNQYDGLTETLQKMASILSHRGPDDEGFYDAVTRDEKYSIALAHRRLSIIDLDSGHQPIGNEDGSIQIVFNGEIYNYQGLRKKLIDLGHVFATNSDTETIVHAYEEYGEDCVGYLRGMFAFAIWDARIDKLVLARDRFGKKPLFFHTDQGTLLFASEIKSLLAYPGLQPKVNTNAVYQYLAYRYVPGPETLFEDIYKLPPATIAIWEEGNLTQHTYYTPPDKFLRNESLLPEDPVGTFLDKLEESVSVRMVSDVPFGAFLSGGIDSSAVVALMSRHSTMPVKTFSIGFAEEEYSELSHAGTIAKEFATDHHEFVISQDHLMNELENLTWYRDAPVAEPSDIPIYLLSKEARRKVKMVLTGEGSDEILGGYPKHVFERYTHAYQMLPSALRDHLIEPLAHSLPYKYRRVKTAITNLGLEDIRDRYPRWFGALSPSERKNLVNLRPFPQGSNLEVQFGAVPSNSLLRKVLFFDQTSWLPDNLLERGDRMTMAASLEARMPFMDHELIELVSSFPDKWRVRGHSTKWILRQAMMQLLPKKILQRPKVGFRVPVNEWFRGPMREYIYDHLTGSDSVTQKYYHNSYLMKVLEEHVKGRQNHEKLLWTMLTLELWSRRYNIQT